MEHSWISRAATLLDDAIIMDWAVHHYNDLPPRSERKAQLENQWFHDLTIKRWIDDPNQETLGLMFMYLPEHCFSNFAATISSHWCEWPTNLANSAARILVSVAPELAAETFRNYLESARPLSFEKAVVILSCLDRFTPGVALPMMEKLLPLAWDDEEFFASIIRHDAFKVAARFMPQALPRLLDGLYTESDHRLNDAVKYMANCLLGHDVYANLYLLRRDEYDIASFNDLAPLFDVDAPLAEIDKIMRSETPLPDALRLLEIHHGRSPESSLAWETVIKSETYRNKNHPVEMAALVLAGVAAAFERKTIDTAALSINDAISLLALDVSTNIHYDALVVRLRIFPKEEVVAAVTNQIEEVKDTYGSVTLARLMGDLGWKNFTPALIGCMGKTQGDYLCEAAQKALLNIGEPARDALIAQWDALDSSQKIYGISVIVGVGGDAVADFSLSRFDELISENIERWCDLALAAPDSRLMERLRPELRRKQQLIDQTYYRLCRLLDVESEKLPELREHILQQQKRQQKAMENFNKGDFVSDRNTLHLSLRCTACGEINDHDVKGVAMDAGGSEKPLVADEFPCLSCGALVDFELEPMAHMTLAAEMFRLHGAREAGEKNITPLISIDTAKSPDGTVQPLPVVYAVLKEKVRSNPDDWLSWFRLGNIVGHLNRPKAALDCFKKAHAINPLSLESIINLAATLIEFDEKKKAFDLLIRSLENSARWQTISSHPAEKGWEIAQLFNQLRRDIGRSDLPVLHPGFLGTTPKAGRNDPCPCGSGKKFKKCCLK